MINVENSLSIQKQPIPDILEWVLASKSLTRGHSGIQYAEFVVIVVELVVVNNLIMELPITRDLCSRVSAS